MCPDILVGLDLGSTSFKAVAATVGGQEVAGARRPTPWSRRAGSVVMPAEAVAAAANAVLEDCLTKAAGGHTVALGITGMAEAGFLTDCAGEVLAPAHAWFDQNGAAQADDLDRLSVEHGFAATTGLRPTARVSAAKIKWLREVSSLPDVLLWESLPEWMARHLGAPRRPERSLAARTGLLDVLTGQWDPELTRWAGLDGGAMPAPQQAGRPWGRVTSGHPDLSGAVITVAGHDHLCASVGAGATGDSDVFASLGTGEAVIGSLGPVDRNTIVKATRLGLSVGIHVIPDRHLAMAGLGTGKRLREVLDVLGVTASQRTRLHHEASALDVSGPAAGWVVEHMRDGTVSAAHPRESDNPAGVWRDALDVAGQRLAEAVSLVECFAGPRSRLIATGGWYRETSFRDARRATVPSPMLLPRVAEATGMGAALLAGLAAGIYTSTNNLPSPSLEPL